MCKKMYHEWRMIVCVLLCAPMIVGRKIRGVNVVTASHRYNQDLRMQTALQDSIAPSVELALENCRTLFKWEPWNCPTTDFLSKKSATLLDRESAFVQTLTIAALIYTVTKNCSRGEIEGCGCNNHHKIRYISNDAGDDDGDGAADWSAMRPDCSDQVDASEQITRGLFEQTPNSRLDAQTYAVIHNNRAARLAVRNSLRKHCRCHGLSGSCAMQTCWMSLNAFPEIAADLRRMYDRAVLLTHDNKGEINEKVRNDALAYVLESPDYCKANAIPGWTGTIGRECSRQRGDTVNTHKKKSCKNLCRACGHRVRKRTVLRHHRCNCKFVWCCNVTCDSCPEYADEYYCD